MDIHLSWIKVFREKWLVCGNDEVSVLPLSVSSSVLLAMILPVLLLAPNKSQEQSSVWLMGPYQAYSLLVLKTDVKNSYICNVWTLITLLLQKKNRNVAIFSICIWASFVPAVTHTGWDRLFSTTQGAIACPTCCKIFWQSACERVLERSGYMSSRHCCF